MGLYGSKTYLKDVKKSTEANREVLKSLAHSAILMTGATGLVCSPIADLIFYANREMGTSITLYLAGRSEERTAMRFPDQKYYFVDYDATKPIGNPFNFHVDYIIHGASNSAPKDISGHGIETMTDNFIGLYELLKYADRERVQNTLYISSSEVYGRKSDEKPFEEDSYGYVDILSPRSSYPSSKRAAETLCACFANERKIKTTIVRPGHIYGPTARRSDNHVSAEFSFRAADGKDIVLKSSGSQIRSWCYCLDSATAILNVLAKGKAANAYNISNPASVASIRKMAELLAEIGGVNLKAATPTEREKAAFNPMRNSSLNSEKLMKLGWQGLFDAKTGFSHTVQIIRESGI